MIQFKLIAMALVAAALFGGGFFTANAGVVVAAFN